VKHTPMMQTVLDQCARGTLSTENFPYYRSTAQNQNPSSKTKFTSGGGNESDLEDSHNNSNPAFGGGGSQQQPKQILVFMVGGLTYHEALLAKRINDATKNATYTQRFAGSAAPTATTTTANNKTKKNNNNNDSDHEDEEDENNSDKLPDSLIGCKVFLGSTAMLTSKTFLRGLPPPNQ
jgi:hypothetical protein